MSGPFYIQSQQASKTPKSVHAGQWRIETWCKRCERRVPISGENALALLALGLDRSVDVSIYTLAGIAGIKAQLDVSDSRDRITTPKSQQQQATTRET